MMRALPPLLLMLALPGCAAGFDARVAESAAAPLPAAATFAVVPQDRAMAGSLEFAAYAAAAGRELVARGLVPAVPGEAPMINVALGWHMGPPREQLVAVRSFATAAPAMRGFWRATRPHTEYQSITRYPASVSLTLTRLDDGTRLYHGNAGAQLDSDTGTTAVPELVHALFAAWPDQGRETARVSFDPRHPERAAHVHRLS